MTLTFAAVVVFVKAGDKEYYTIANYDSGLSSATNQDNAMKAVEKAIFAKGILECHDLETRKRTYINLQEFKTAAITNCEVLDFVAEL